MMSSCGLFDLVVLVCAGMQQGLEDCLNAVFRADGSGDLFAVTIGRRSVQSTQGPGSG